MPFTISHTAAVLPFSRLLARWHMLSAVIIGAMVPDFHVYIPWHLQRSVTHSLQALVTFCLPVGLATYWAFQLLVKVPVVEVLPDGAYVRWKPFAAPASLQDGQRWLLAAIGVLLGALTHLLWDAFTHEGARGVRMIPMLDEPIFDYGRHHIAGVRLVQDGSSLLGLIAVSLMVLYALRPGPPSSTPRRVLEPRERSSLGYRLRRRLSGAHGALCVVGSLAPARFAFNFLVGHRFGSGRAPRLGGRRARRQHRADLATKGASR